MTERTLSELQKEYRAFFLGKLNQYGVKSPAWLTKAQKSEFFTAIKNEWAQVKNAKQKPQPITIVEEDEEPYLPLSLSKGVRSPKTAGVDKPQRNYPDNVVAL
jgi:hypothetical protein